MKLGRVGGRRVLATVEPWHGAGVAVYAEKPGAPLWTKTTIETALTEGHALGWADFDGDGDEELAVGWRRGKPGVAVYFVDRDGALKSKMLVDDGGMDTEDLIVGDFNGDTLPDHRRVRPGHAEHQDLLERDEKDREVASSARHGYLPHPIPESPRSEGYGAVHDQSHSSPPACRGACPRDPAHDQPSDQRRSLRPDPSPLRHGPRRNRRSPPGCRRRASGGRDGAGHAQRRRPRRGTGSTASPRDRWISRSPWRTSQTSGGHCW